MSRPGTSVVEFFVRFPNEEACLEHVFLRQIADGFVCPRCRTLGYRKKVKETKKYYHRCKWQYSPLAGTIFGRSNLSLMAWFYALLLFANSGRGIKANFFRKQLGIGMKAAHRLGISIRTHIAFASRSERLGGPGKKVYVNEALINIVRDGHEDRNAIVMGLACEGTVLCGIIADRRAATLLDSIERFVEPESTIVSDALSSYAGISKKGWHHIVVNHSVAFQDFEGNNTNQIEAFWSVLKRNMRSYRQVAADYLWCYLAETEFAYNRRRSSWSAFEELIDSFPQVTPQSLAKIKERYIW